MTKPVNLYLLSRIPGEDAFNRVCRHTAEKLSRHRTASHEIESLRALADTMISCGLPVTSLDGFFFGYTIPQIGKEFDTLKFCQDACLGIELKSKPVPLEQMRTQLLRNRHYLSHLGRDLHLFTFVSDTGQCFHLEGDVLAPVSASDIAEAVRDFDRAYLTEIDGLFRPSEYIVSPSGTPDKYLAHEYFLTQAQDQIQKGLLAALNDTTGMAFFSLTGKPGTGKTLLLYDVARTLCAQSRTAILHWGKLGEGHHLINEADIGLTILPWRLLEEERAVAAAEAPGRAGTAAGNRADVVTPGRAATAAEAPGCAGVEAGSGDAAAPDCGEDEGGFVQPLLAPFSYLLVDEAHRLSPRQFGIICQTAERYQQRVVFCLDPEQILTTADRKTNIAARVAALPPVADFTLSERMRGNRELQAFIQEVRDLNHPPRTHMDYRDVELAYAATIEEGRRQIAYYRDQDYVFINYYRPASGNAGGRAKTGGSAENPFAQFEGGYDIYHVIGQEFDRVVLLLDQSFYYSEDGKLEGVPSPDPDILYPNLFYQSITRVQEKLALIVLDNEPLFDRIAQLLD